MISIPTLLAVSDEQLKPIVECHLRSHEVQVPAGHVELFIARPDYEDR